MKSLVVFFSPTGHTRKVAHDIAKYFGSDILELKPEIPYTESDLDGYNESSRTFKEQHDPKSRPALKNNVEDLSLYKVVFLGFPIWWYVAPKIINTFIEENNLEGKNVYCFATSYESPIGPCVEALKDQYPQIEWREGKLLNHISKETLEVWKHEIGL